MASAYALFLPEQPVSASYLLTWLILLYVGYTMLSISHMSWGQNCQMIITIAPEFRAGGSSL